MSKNNEDTLQKQLKKMNFSELTDIAKLAIKSDNLTLLKLIEKQNKKVFNKDQDLGKNIDNIFNVCKYGTLDTVRFLEQKKFDFTVKDPITGNRCQHIASMYGNIQLLEGILKDKKELSMNEQNNKKETPLHVALKYGQYRYEKTTMLLSRFTDMTLKDEDEKEPHRIRMKNFKQNVRLSEYLQEKFIKQKARQQKLNEETK